MSKRVEQSIKQKLKNLSKSLNLPFNALLDALFLERFLVRVGKSGYIENLTFKGGRCLAQFIELGRVTKDLDFLLSGIKGTIDGVKGIVEEIASIDVGDNFDFSLEEVHELPIEHKKYPGFRVSVQGRLGKINNKVSVDIGVGDVVRPKFMKVELLRSKEPLFEEGISLNLYPPEYIFSEKIEAILYRGELNSRMKDFYDCYRLVQSKVFDELKAQKALVDTMKNRGTKLTLISGATDVFTVQWKSFLRKNKMADLDLKDVVSTINMVLRKAIDTMSPQ